MVVLALIPSSSLVHCRQDQISVPLNRSNWVIPTVTMDTVKLRPALLLMLRHTLICDASELLSVPQVLQLASLRLQPTYQQLAWASPLLANQAATLPTVT